MNELWHLMGNSVVNKTITIPVIFPVLNTCMQKVVLMNEFSL